MAEISRVKFDPVTKEIEIEGSASFVTAAFAKVQAILSGTPKAVVKEPKVGKGRPAKKATQMGIVLALFKGSTEVISTIELKEKTGLTERQLWGIVTRAAKEGRIRKVKRGVYAKA